MKVAATTANVARLYGEVNWTLIAAAARTGDSHYRAGGDLSVHEHERNTAD